MQEDLAYSLPKLGDGGFQIAGAEQTCACHKSVCATVGAVGARTPSAFGSRTEAGMVGEEAIGLVASTGSPFSILF